MWDTPELVGQAKQQLGELEDKSLPNLVQFQRDILCLCVCCREMIPSSIGPRDQLLNPSSCPNLDLSVGHRQIRLEPTIFVMLSYSWLIPRAYTITSFGLTNTITLFT